MIKRKATSLKWIFYFIKNEYYIKTIGINLLPLKNCI